MPEGQLVQHINHLGETNHAGLKEAIRRARENEFRPELTYQGKLPAQLPAWYGELQPGEKRVWVEPSGGVRLVERSADGSARRISDQIGMLGKDSQNNLGVFYFQNDNPNRGLDNVAFGRTHFRTPLELFREPIPFALEPGVEKKAVAFRDQSFSGKLPAVQAPLGAPKPAGAAQPSPQRASAGSEEPAPNTVRMPNAPGRVVAGPPPRQIEAIFSDVKPKKREVGQVMQSSVPMWISGQKAFLPLMSNGQGRSIALAKGELFTNARIQDLPRGKSYNYIILPDGTMDFGMRTNAAELGVKHVQLAEGRGVVSAGEIQIAADGTVRFNNESGSYARDISGRIGAKNLAEKTRQAFRAHGIDPQPGLPKIEAEALTPGDLRELCAVSHFIQNNPHLCSMAH